MSTTLNQAAYDAWVAHHAVKYREYTPRGLAILRTIMPKLGSPAVQMASVQQSIANEWQGLWPPRGVYAVKINLDDVELT